jgi:hypothetical protein
VRTSAVPGFDFQFGDRQVARESQPAAAVRKKEDLTPVIVRSGLQRIAA